MKMENIQTKSENTHWVKIYLSGPISVIEQTCRQACKEEGMCVTVEPTKFIYTGGEEVGAVVGLVNYPRFPKDREAINSRARSLAVRLLEATLQDSAMVMTPEQTEWITLRHKGGEA
jgi:hypothetical protein